MDIALQINNLGKAYGKHQVLENISFTVVKGEIFALLGTNGAGKTTTLECLVIDRTKASFTSCNCAIRTPRYYCT